MDIGELSSSETLEISKDFIKFSECQGPLRKFKSPLQDFLATVLVFELHIFSRDNLVAFDSYQYEKARNTRFMNLAVVTIWVRFTWRICSCVWDFYGRGKRVATCSSRCAFKSLSRHTYYIGSVCLLFFLNTDKKNTDVILIKNVDHKFCQIFQLWRFRLLCLWQLIILFPPAK